MVPNQNSRKKNAKLKSRHQLFQYQHQLRQKIDEFKTDADHFDTADLFDELPISKQTLDGLKKTKYEKLTDIQKRAIPLALKKLDVLGAAKTGSGKTLAFLIPVLENLFHLNWTIHDGLGALIITPTRELALQIFEVLRKIGQFHPFSAGLIIGGKSYIDERNRLNKMNIIIGTPGRILQHMDQTSGFTTDNMQMLVLDEADRILDMGFERTLDAILNNLPANRQTLLFSATQTQKIKDLARLSLKNPTLLSIADSDDYSTPHDLHQYYVQVDLSDKVNMLFSFLRTHVNSKIIVFFSTCKETRYFFESFRHLQPGIPLLHLHGKQKQITRQEIYSKFVSNKCSALFCTDIASRGLDFANVEWVVQVDLPEDKETYIHRVGRTARFYKSGKALLFIQPEELEFLTRLESIRIPIDKLNIKNSKLLNVQSKLQQICFKDGEIKLLAQKALVSYVRSVWLRHDKEVFQIDKDNLGKYASSLGLSSLPNLRFLKQPTIKSSAMKVQKSISEISAKTNSSSDSDSELGLRGEYEEEEKVLANDNANDDEFFSIKRSDHPLETVDISELSNEFVPSKRQMLLAKSKKEMAKRMPKGERVKFDDDGNAIHPYNLESIDSFLESKNINTEIESFVNEQKEQLSIADTKDKEQVREKLRQKKRKLKISLSVKDLERNYDNSSGDSDNDLSRPVKKIHQNQYIKDSKFIDTDTSHIGTGLEDDEQLALKMLNT